jgi:hypothetical protein
MKRQPALALLLLALPLAAAADSSAYQDGILTKVRTTVVDNSCSAAVYTVAVAGTEYELTPDHSRVARASAYLPLSATILRQSSLANHMPGTAVKLRRDEDGFLVLVGKRESHYHVFVAH